jgi:hypothetical protein
VRVSSETSTPRLFSLEEANALIPKLELIMERMQRRGIELRAAIEALAREGSVAIHDIEVSELLERRPELGGLVQELEELIGEIEGFGGQFKGLELGLVDFPSEIEGQIGLLCWQYGEKEITHWHPLETGFDGRQPLPATARRSYLQ